MAYSKKLRINESSAIKFVVSCGVCKRHTNHLVLVSADVIETEEYSNGADSLWEVTHQVIQCQGCDTISFRKCSHYSGEYIQVGPEDWVRDEHVELFPNRNEGRNPIKDVALLPSDVERIYSETLKALNGDQPVLSGIGVRALIETISKERNANGKNLEDKINDLVVQGVLTKDGADNLHKLRVLGNKAAHEVKPHSLDQLYVALDVVEHLLNGVYVLPHLAKRNFE